MDVARAADLLRSRLAAVPPVAVVLGSGLGHLESQLVEPTVVRFEDVPGFPGAGVQGHAGRFVAGRLEGCDLLFQSGRYHMYEGHALDVVAAPVRVLAAIGVRTIVFTNAAGGIRPDLGPGELVLLDDHINAMFRSPLIGPVEAGEQRFPDMSAPYDAELRSVALAAAAEMTLPLGEGTYAAVLGPSYETPAEVRMLDRMGADVVGMSTVPEVLVARALGLRCLAFSVVTNKAAGLGGVELSHDDVVEVGREAGGRLARLLVHLLPAVERVTQAGSTK